MTPPRLAIVVIVEQHPGLTLTELGKHVQVSRPLLIEGVNRALDRGTITTRPLPRGSHHACTYWPVEAW